MTNPVEPDAHQPMVKKAGDVGKPGGFRDTLFDVLHEDAVKTGVAVLRGYIGDNNNTTNVRLYSSLEFNDYVDIPLESVVTVVDLRTPSDTLAGQAVWVRLGANLIRGRTGVTKHSLQSEFLGGDIGSTGSGTRGGGGYSPSPWCGGGYSPSPWCGGGYSPSPWCSG